MRGGPPDRGGRQGDAAGTGPARARRHPIEFCLAELQQQDAPRLPRPQPRGDAGVGGAGPFRWRSIRRLLAGRGPWVHSRTPARRRRRSFRRRCRLPGLVPAGRQSRMGRRRRGARGTDRAGPPTHRMGVPGHPDRRGRGRRTGTGPAAAPVRDGGRLVPRRGLPPHRAHGRADDRAGHRAGGDGADRPTGARGGHRRVQRRGPGGPNVRRPGHTG